MSDNNIFQAGNGFSERGMNSFEDENGILQPEHNPYQAEGEVMQAEGGSLYTEDLPQQAESDAHQDNSSDVNNGLPDEQIGYDTPDGRHVDVPIFRANMPDLFIALNPPHALPYIMAPTNTEPQVIVDFFAAHVEQVEELRKDMFKRFAKSDSLKCKYQTGDIAFVLGHPFQLRIFPHEGKKQRPRSGIRTRTTSKYFVDANISLLTLYVAHPKNYDEARNAFLGYGEQIILNNARHLTEDITNRLEIKNPPSSVHVRAMRDRIATIEAGMLMLSQDLIPYPPDCLVYALWSELEKLSLLPKEEINKRLENMVPNWRNAKQMLIDKAKPFSNQA